jgi:predicted transcriptional regulator
MLALTAGPVDRAAVAEIMQRDVSVAERLVRDLAAEGLCLASSTTLTLP